MNHEKRILIINNEAAVHRAFDLGFEDSGYQLTIVTQGDQGVEEIKNKHYHLIFLNILKPDLLGIRTVQHIRALTMTVPIYIITLFDRDILIGLDEARKAGLPFQVLRKPIGSIELLAIAQSVLDRPIPVMVSHEELAI